MEKEKRKQGGGLKSLYLQNYRLQRGRAQNRQEGCKVRADKVLPFLLESGADQKLSPPFDRELVELGNMLQEQKGRREYADRET